MCYMQMFLTFLLADWLKTDRFWIEVKMDLKDMTLFETLKPIPLWLEVKMIMNAL